jgi:hypothetical protein
MLIYTDIVSGKDVVTDSYPVKLLSDGAIMEVESKKVQVGGEAIDIGANASAEEAEEKLDDEVKTVINVIEAHGLQKVELELKDFKTMQTAYWKDLLNAINAKRHEILFGDKAPPTDKEELKKAEAAAEKKLNAYDKGRYDVLQTQFANYKKHFNALQAFVKDEIVKNFKDFDFYLPAEPATLGKCMIIPARYIGEATAPVFYFYVAGLLEEKA